jgi:Flp pilus assembly protein TadG
MRLNTKQRKGAAVVECALVYPIVFILTIGFVTGVMGVFRYQEVATLSREAARYASVHGAQYGKILDVTPPTPEDIFRDVILARAVALDRNQIGYSITYNQNNGPVAAKIVNNDVIYTTNTVTVVVTYQWIPEAFLGGITLSSTSSMPMSY